MAEALGVALCSVLRALRFLEAAGWIQTEGHYTHAYRVAARIPFTVKKALPIATAATYLSSPNPKTAMPSQDLPQGDLTDLQHSPLHEGTATAKAIPVEIHASNLPSPNPKIAIPTPNLPQGDLTDLQASPSHEGVTMADTPQGICHRCNKPSDIATTISLTELQPSSSLADAAETPTDTEAKISPQNSAPASVGIKGSGYKDGGEGLGKADFQLGGKAFSETPNFGGVEKPSNTGPLPKDSSPSAGKAHASPSPRTVAHLKASWLLKNAVDPVAEYRGALAEEEKQLAALREELKQAPAELKQQLEWKIQELDGKVKLRRRRLAEVEGKLGTGLLAGPDDLPAVQCGGDG